MLVTYKTAILAKQLGFNEECLHWYELFIEDLKKSDPELKGPAVQDEDIYSVDSNYTIKYENNSNSNICAVPTQEELSAWLRKEHNLYVLPVFNLFNGGLTVELYKKTKHPVFLEELKSYLEYEEAMEDGLYGALKYLEKCKKF